MIRTKRKGLLAALAVLAALCVTLFVGTQVAYAETVVTYDHSGGGKRVVEDDGTYVVYCIQDSRSPSSTVGDRANERRKYFWNAALEEGTEGSAYANGLVYALYQNRTDKEPGNYQFTDEDWKAGEGPLNMDVDDNGQWAYGLKHLLLATLYYGYPYNKGSETFTEAETQEAIYWCIYAGKNGGYTESSYYNRLVEYVRGHMYDFDTTFPEWWDLSLYVYLPFGQAQQALIRATYAIEPYVSNTTVKANNEEPTPVEYDEEGNISQEEAPAKVEIQAGDEVTVVDTVTLNGLENGKKYTVEWELIDVATKQRVATVNGTKSVDATGSSHSFEIQVGDFANLNGTYTIHTILKAEDGTVLSDHNSGFDIVGETFEVTVPGSNTEEKGNLVIKKTFTGNLTDADKNKLSITIEGKDIDGEGKNTKTITFADFANGEYKVEGLPVGEKYTVKETNADGLSADYALVTADSTTEGTATITANADATVALKNTYEPKDSGGSEPKIINTTAKLDGKTGEVALADVTDGTFTDEVSFDGLEEGKTYTVASTLYKDEAPVTTVTNQVTSASKSITVTFDTKITEAGTYTVKTILRDGDGYEFIHNDKLDDSAEKVTVTETQPVGDNPEIKTSATGTVKPEANQTITDTITWYNLPAGKYTAAGTLVDANGNEIASEGGSVDFEVTEADAEKGQGTVDVTFAFDASSLKAGDKIVVFEKLLVDGKPYTYTATDAEGNETETPVVHEDLTDVSQTVTVEKPTLTTGDEEPKDDEPTPSGGGDTPQPEPGPEPEPVPGVIRTTVSANGVQGSAAAPIKFDTGGVVPVVDTITYTGLQAGATYAVTGTLMQVKDNVATAVPGGTVVENKTADSANGTWTMDFGYLTMEENAYYVVYEEAVNVDDSSDAAEHKDMTDLAQAIVVGEGLEEINIDNPPTTFTSASTPDIKTTVSAGGKAASTTAPVNLTAAEAGKVSTVTDTVAYTNVPAGTYVLVGSLMSSKDNFEEPVAEGMKVVTVAEGAEASGTWAIDIEDVKLAEDTKYVVFEYLVVADSIEQVNEAVNAGTELPLVLAAHEDSNDVAQTIVVAKKPTTTAPPTTTTPATSGVKTTAKTVDDMGGTALAMFALAVVAAGGVLVARRKGSE